MNKYTKLTNEQWQSIVDIVPECQEGGAPEKWPRRDIVDAILYKFATGCTWRQLPKTYPFWNTVFVYYNRWSKDGTWFNVLLILRPGILIPSDPSTNNSYIDVTIRQRNI